MARFGTSTINMRLVITLLFFALPLLGIFAGFGLGAILLSSDYHEGELLALIEERGIPELLAENDPANHELVSRRLEARTPILALALVADNETLFETSYSRESKLPDWTKKVFNSGRIVNSEGRLFYNYASPQAGRPRLVLELTREPRPWRSSLSGALARFGDLPSWSIYLGLLGLILLSAGLAFSVVWFFHTRHLSKVFSLLESCETPAELAETRALDGRLGPSLLACLNRLKQADQISENSRYENLIPRQLGYDFPDLDAAAVFVDPRPERLTHLEIRQLANGKYGIILLAVEAGEQAQELLIRSTAIAQAGFEVFESPTKLVALLNRYLLASRIPTSLKSGFVLIDPASRELEFSFNGDLVLVRHDLRAGKLRGYRLEQPPLTGLAEIKPAFARLELGSEDPLLLAFAETVDWESLVTEVLQKTNTFAERQNLLRGLLSARIEADQTACALLLGLR